jgi:hypothetical protein
MASKRGRKRNRKKQQKAKLVAPQGPPRQPPTPPGSPAPSRPPESFHYPSLEWLKFPKWVWVMLVVLATTITLLEGYPWLSIEDGPLLDPNDAYSELFQLKNGGYIPVTDLNAFCAPTMAQEKNSLGVSGINFGYAGSPFDTLANINSLMHDQTVTLPCFQTIALRSGRIPAGSSFDITITYAFFHLNFHPLRRSQTFHFESLIGADHSQHWIRR